MDRIDTACIIDDDNIFIYGLKRMMQVAKFCDSIMIYRDGQEALDSLKAIISNKEKLPDVILLDLNMPILDGWQFLDEFVQIELDKKIIIYIVSSSVDPADVLRAQEYSAVTNYILKPVSMEVLQEIFQDIKRDITPDKIDK